MTCYATQPYVVLGYDDFNMIHFSLFSTFQSAKNLRCVNPNIYYARGQSTKMCTRPPGISSEQLDSLQANITPKYENSRLGLIESVP